MKELLQYTSGNSINIRRFLRCPLFFDDFKNSLDIQVGFDFLKFSESMFAFGSRMVEYLAINPIDTINEDLNAGANCSLQIRKSNYLLHD